jgi:hypothetical protein
MKTPAMLLLWLLAANGYAESWTPSERFMRAVRRIESADGRFTVGDQGRSLGDYQISEAAWHDVSAWRKARGLPVFDYYTDVWRQPISRTYAADYLKILRQQLKKHLQREPSAAELYGAYNMGMSSFAQRNFRIAPINPGSARAQLIQTAHLGQ